MTQGDAGRSPGRRPRRSSTARRSSATQLNATTTRARHVRLHAARRARSLGAGAAQTLSTTFTPTDAANYTTATASVTITVTKATPVITWATPADIVYGTALSATQLNATTSVPGTFVYTPAGRHGPQRRRGADAVDDVHADRHRELHDRDGQRDDHGDQGDAGDHLGGAGEHRLRHGAERDAAECDGERAGHVRLHAGARARSCNAGAAQTLSTTFTPTDPANYTTATGERVDHGDEGDAGRSPGRRPPSIVYGTPLSATQLNATAGVAGAFVYTPRGGTRPQRRGGADAVGDVHADRRGELQHRDGECADYGEQGDADDHLGAPASIVSGTALSATQLNATANMPGSFVYSAGRGNGAAGRRRRRRCRRPSRRPTRPTTRALRPASRSRSCPVCRARRRRPIARPA